MALRAGIQSGGAIDRMYGDGIINSARRSPPTGIWRSIAKAEKAA